MRLRCGKEQKVQGDDDENGKEDSLHSTTTSGTLRPTRSKQHVDGRALCPSGQVIEGGQKLTINGKSRPRGEAREIRGQVEYT